MRPVRRPMFALLTTVAVALALAACSSATPGWTYAPVASASGAPAGSGATASGAAASGAAASGPAGSGQQPSQAAGSALPASGGPTGSAAPGGSGGSGGGTGDVIKISAQGIQFEQGEANAPAGKEFKIAFENKDAGVPHNVSIKDASGQLVFEGETFSGPATKTEDVKPALKAGSYQFVCTVHPNMVGTLTVQ
jgi:plastocyanin